MSGHRSTARLRISSALIACLSLVFAACTSAPTSVPSASSTGSGAPTFNDGIAPGAPYKIGLLPTISGAAFLNGKRMQWGAELARDEINAAGGINGHPIELLLEDSQLNPTIAVSVMNKMINVGGAKAFVIMASAVINAVKPLAPENKVVMINHAAVNPTIADAQNYVFTNIPDAASEAATIVDYAVNKLGIKTAATLTSTDDLGRGAQAAFKNAFEAKGGKVVAAESYDTNNVADLRPQLLKIRDVKPDAVYATGAANAIKQGNSVGIKTQWLSNVFFEAADTLTLAGPLAEGAYYTFFQFDPANNSRAKSFYDAYQMKYQGANKDKDQDPTPHIYAVTAYDAVYMYAEAFKNVGYDGTRIRDYLAALKDWQGAAGLTTFAKNGAIVVPVGVKTVKDGKFKYVQKPIGR
jgi:branched-chain amino acid transport system substrate-binding protein